MPPHGEAEEEPIVEPNEYQEKDIDIQTEYFHEEELLEQKQKLPEEQKDLTFERGKYDVIRLGEGLTVSFSCNGESK